VFFRLPEFSVVTNVKVMCGTFNTNARYLSPESSLSDWLTPPHLEIADVYAIGFQEIVPLNSRNVALSGGQSTSRALYWQQAVQECLDNTELPFTLVVERHLVGILLLVFARVSLMPQITDVRTSAVGVGLMGVMGNKGGVCMRMTVYETSICFVCAHLQANREAVMGRNSDYRNIIEKIIFAPNPDSIQQIIAQRDHDRAARRWSYADWLECCSILDHDLVFWLGDLNYRIDENVPTERVFAWCHNNSWEMMRDVDQLNIERAKGSVFNGFSEAPLTFPPTYKFIPNTGMYDERVGAKIRAPAWCDRVLWRTHRHQDICVLLDYRCTSRLQISDHRPVAAQFEVGARIADLDKEREVYNEQLHILDKMDNEMTPVMAVEGLMCNFGEVKPMVSFMLL
jgi:phosphatidylinositol-bisphosphatase